jgi:membrane fusion protein (multidrug efflux system)
MSLEVSKRTIIVAVAVLAVGFGGWRYYSASQSEPRGMRGNMTRNVVGVVAKKETIGDRLEAIGTLIANESVDVTAKTQGIIRSIDFEDGQTFKKGEQIAAIDAGEQDAALNVELANLEQQRKEVERTQSLRKDNFVSQARVDETNANLKRAEATVSAARVRSGDRRIVAPFSGIVGTRRISLGALVSPGTVVTTLDDISEVKLDFSIPETFLSSLKAGLEIEAGASAYAGEKFKGLVVAVDSRVDPVTRSVSVRAIIPNPDLKLRPGMLMIVELIKDKRESIMVPEIAVTPENNQQFVYTVGPDSVVKRLAVVIGRRTAGAVEITEGLKEGDIVITEGLQDLRPGSKVNLTNASELRGDAPAPAARNEGPRHAE